VPSIVRLARHRARIPPARRTTVKSIAEALGLGGFRPAAYGTAMGLFTSGLGCAAHLDAAVRPALICFCDLQPLRTRRYEEAARDQGATARGRASPYVVLPIIAPSVGRHRAVSAFTLSWDEGPRARARPIGDLNTLPLELEGLTTTVTNPEIYALGTITTAVSFAVIFTALGPDCHSAQGVPANALKSWLLNHTPQSRP